MFSCIRHNLRVHMITTFEDAKDDGFMTRTSATLTSHTLWPEVGFVDFYFPSERVLVFTELGQSHADFEVDRVD